MNRHSKSLANPNDRAVEQEVEHVRAKLIEAEQSGFVAPDRNGILTKIKTRRQRP
jgi:hypothetical protein